MNLKLQRTAAREDGVFGTLLDDAGHTIAFTLEHAYASGEGSFSAKIPPGGYTCKRGQHQLEGMAAPFTTFQVMDVPNHTNILLHFGNYNKDSDGCILLGEAIVPIPTQPGSDMIINSRKTWQKFMDLQTGIDEFKLTVTGV